MVQPLSKHPGLRKFFKGSLKTANHSEKGRVIVCSKTFPRDMSETFSILLKSLSHNLQLKIRKTYNLVSWNGISMELRTIELSETECMVSQTTKIWRYHFN